MIANGSLDHGTPAGSRKQMPVDRELSRTHNVSQRLCNKPKPVVVVVELKSHAAFLFDVVRFVALISWHLLREIQHVLRRIWYDALRMAEVSICPIHIRVPLRCRRLCFMG